MSMDHTKKIVIEEISIKKQMRKKLNWFSVMLAVDTLEISSFYILIYNFVTLLFLSVIIINIIC